MKVVSPFRPFMPESPAHRKLGPFDWVGALAMLRTSVALSCRCDTIAITDVDTDLPAPTYRYATKQRRLMLWILEVSLCYLESSDFDQDTVMCSPDLLVFADLSRWFTGADLGVLARLEPKYVARGRPLLNGVQFWSYAAKPRLARFFREALALAQTLPEEALRWGADTEPLQRLLAPLTRGRSHRAGLLVDLIPHTSVMGALSDRDIDGLVAGRLPLVTDRAVMDFKGPRRKKAMRAYFEATLGQAVPV